MTDHLDAAFQAALGTRAPYASWCVTHDGRRLTERKPGRMFSAASMIKTFVLAAVLDGGAALDGVVEVSPDLRASGDGVLRHLHLPARFRLDDLLWLMIVLSDNTATNAVIRAYGGPERVNETLAGWGYESRLLGSVGAAPELPSEPRLGVTSAEEHERIVLHLHDRGGPGIEMLLAQQDRRSLARLLDEESRFAHKTGTIDGVRHDGGVLLLGESVLAVSVFTDGGPHAEWVDHPACVGMGLAMAWTCELLGLPVGLVPGTPPLP